MDAVTRLVRESIELDNGHRRCKFCRQQRHMQDWTDEDHDKKCPVLAVIRMAESEGSIPRSAPPQPKVSYPTPEDVSARIEIDISARHRQGKTYSQAEMAMLRSYPDRMRAGELHPWYGPCDGLGVNDECSECQKFEAAAPALPAETPPTSREVPCGRFLQGVYGRESEEYLCRHCGYPKGAHGETPPKE